MQKFFLKLAFFIVIFSFTSTCYSAEWAKASFQGGLYGVWGTSDSNVYAAGENGLFIHFNGIKFEILKSYTSSTLRGVWGYDERKLLLVGDKGTVVDYQDGEITQLNPGVTNDLYDIWGNSRFDMFVVGNGVALYVTVGGWNKMVHLWPYKFFSVWGRTYGDVYFTRNEGELYHFDSESLRLIAKLFYGDMRGVWGNKSELFLIGNDENNKGSIFHNKASNWTAINEVSQYALRDIYGIGESDVYVVGDNGFMSHYNGTDWKKIDLGTTDNLTSIWGTAKDSLFVTSDKGNIYYMKKICHLALPDVLGMKGQSVKVPIEITNEQHVPIEKINLDITFKETIVTYSGIEFSQALKDKGYKFYVQANETGTISISAESTGNPITANFTIGYIEFLVQGNKMFYGPTHKINISQARINNTIPSFSSSTLTLINNPPSLSSLNNVVINEDQGAISLVFDVKDLETPIEKLKIIAGSLNAGIVKTEQIVTSGDGSQRIVSIVPNQDAFGNATICVVLNDGEDTASTLFAFYVKPVNDPPSFVPGQDIILDEDSGEQKIQWASRIKPGPENESNQKVSFFVQCDNSDLFDKMPEMSSDGVMTFKLKLDSYGMSKLFIRLEDDGGTENNGQNVSLPYYATIMVKSVDDNPSFVKGKDIMILEDAEPQLFENWATQINPGAPNELYQNLMFEVSTDNMKLFSKGPTLSSNGTLNFTPALNISGVANVKVKLIDGADEAFKDYETFTITIKPVNDSPSFVKGPNIETMKNVERQVLSYWAKNINPGPKDELYQTVKFNVQTVYEKLFSEKPSISSDGTLAFTPAENISGETAIYITLSDNGGTENGGIDTSMPQTFYIRINPLFRTIEELESTSLQKIIQDLKTLSND